MNRVLLWIAQGFGAGRAPLAPGTAGSLVGLLWFAVLLLPGSFGLFLAGTVAGLALSVWLCDVGEKTLRQQDPGSVVFDEIAAMPLCFAGWVAIIVFRTGALPLPAYFVAPGIWPLTLGVFVAFRLFDIAKPWPVRQSQRLHGGLGVTIDDALAAVYVNVVVLSAHGASVLFRR